jgi:hypothetical protein
MSVVPILPHGKVHQSNSSARPTSCRTTSTTGGNEEEVSLRCGLELVRLRAMEHGIICGPTDLSETRRGV